MAKEVFKCTNPKCKTKAPKELNQLNEETVHLENYCIKNKKTLSIDEAKLRRLTSEAVKLRCNTCFKNFIKRNKLTGLYHLV